MRNLSRLVTSFIGTSTLVLQLFAPVAMAADTDASKIAKLKSEIISIAQANQQCQLNILEVKAQLVPLIKELLTLAPSKKEATQLSLVAGGWRNLWSDMVFPPTVDLTQNYQVVSAKGFYYNVSRQTFLGLEGTGLLRGQYTDGGDFLNIEFTRNALASGWLAPGTNLADFANKVESEAIASTEIPGPDGVTGMLKNTYVDKDLRIITGGDSTGEEGLLYIMTRADFVVAP